MKEIFCGVYKITNKINNKIYIGQSVNIYKRWYYEKKGYVNTYLKRAFDKYGVDQFKFEILYLCLQAELDTIEKFYINKYKSNDYNHGYNIGPGGNNRTAFGKKWYNNGDIEHQFMPQDEIPDGFKKGRICGKGKAWFNDGEKEMFCFECPEGFKKGRLLESPFAKMDRSGKNNSMWGKKHSEETKKKISETIKQKKLIKI